MDRLKNIIVNNFFSSVNNVDREEIIEKLLENKNITIERIISTGQKSPDDFWYNQEKDEWVFLLKGSAILKFKDSQYLKQVELKPGDYLLIPAHCEHRVEWTSQSETSYWLAIYL
jgi:cupin 2 domain-containing protein